MDPLHHIPILPNPYLRRGQIIRCLLNCEGNTGLHYHVGPETCMSDIEFDLKLTPRDRLFLEGLRILVNPE